MTNEYESGVTIAEIVNTHITLWGADGLTEEEAEREWTPGSDEDENPFGEFKEEAK